VNFGRVYCDFLVYIFYSSIFWDTRRWIKSKSTIRFLDMLQGVRIHFWGGGIHEADSFTSTDRMMVAVLVISKKLIKYKSSMNTVRMLWYMIV